MLDNFVGTLPLFMYTLSKAPISTWCCALGKTPITHHQQAAEHRTPLSIGAPNELPHQVTTGQIEASLFLVNVQEYIGWSWCDSW